VIPERKNLFFLSGITNIKKNYVLNTWRPWHFFKISVIPEREKLIFLAAHCLQLLQRGGGDVPPRTAIFNWFPRPRVQKIPKG